MTRATPEELAAAIKQTIEAHGWRLSYEDSWWGESVEGKLMWIDDTLSPRPYDVDEKDLRIYVYRQGFNPEFIRITHIPSGVVGECAGGPGISQLKAKVNALESLKANEAYQKWWRENN